MPPVKYHDNPPGRLYEPLMIRTLDADKIGWLIREIAAAEILPRWRNLQPHEIETKSGPTDFVTAADRLTEAALARALTAMHPGSRVVGEETFADDPACLAHLGQTEPAWIIDPIDGTGAFTRGEPGFGSMLALVHGQELTAAWILQPTSGDLYLAERGAGVRHVAADGAVTRLAPKAPASPAGMTGIVSGALVLDGQRVYRDAIRHHFGQAVSMRCPAIDYPRVLRGEVHFTAYAKCLPWDHLPGQMLLREIGWTAAKLDGSDYRVGDMTGGVMSAPGKDAWAAIRRRLLSPR